MVVGTEIRPTESAQSKSTRNKDIEYVLKVSGVYEDVINGEAECLFCGNKITFHNMNFLTVRENKVRFICNKPECCSKLAEQRNIGSIRKI